MKWSKRIGILLSTCILTVALFASTAFATTVEEIPDYTLKIGADYYAMSSSFFDDEHLFAGFPLTYTAHFKINGKWFDIMTATDDQMFGIVEDPGVGVNGVKETASRTYYDDQKVLRPVTNDIPADLMATSITIENTSSLNLTGGPDIADLSNSVWVVKADSNNIYVGDVAANPIGTMTITFNKDIKKENLSDISIFLNGSTAEPTNANIIKQLLFTEFATAGAANELVGDILLNYADLKDALTIFNDSNPVSQIAIRGNSVVGASTATITLNLE